MKNKQGGFIVPVLIVLAVLVVGGGVYYFSQKKSPDTQDSLARTPAQTAPVTPSTTNPDTTTNKTSVQATTSVTVKTQVAPTNTTKASAPAPAKNIYTNSGAGYSLELPQGWGATEKPAMSVAGQPAYSGTYFSPKGSSTTGVDYTFDMQSAPTQTHIEQYQNQYGKTPTNDDMFNSFIETQKSVWDGFQLQETHKVMINGNQAYEASSLFSGGGGTQRFYVFYTPKNTYIVMIQATTDTWPTNQATLLGIVGTLKIQ